MALLSDKELHELIIGGHVVGVKSHDWSAKSDPIQAASIDLQIGEIFLPGEFDGGGLPIARDEVVLSEGHTAVIRTEEALKLPSTYAGICFPPSRVSFKGLLMTNPGHIDPGYQGNLRFTVINMGKEAYTLRKGDTIATLLVLKLTKAPVHDWFMRNPPQAPPPDSRTVIKPVLDRLSRDFLNVTKRADEAVTRAETKVKWFIGLGTIAAPILLWGVSNVPLGTEKQVNKLEQRVEMLEKKLDVDAVKTRVEALESRTDNLESTVTKRGATKQR